MAGSSRITRAQAPRVLQLGLDRILDDVKDVYKGPGDKLFTSVSTKKAYYEMMKMSGVGLAAEKGEGSAIQYGSRDQAWVYTMPIVTYEKSVRITYEAIEDNLYENQLSECGREIQKAIDSSRDTVQAGIFNDAFTSGVTYGDGSVYSSTSHTLQSGDTNSNRLATNSDLSEDSLEAMKILVDAMKNDDGILGDYETKDLLIHPSNQFESHRILKSMGRVSSADNDTNALKDMGIVRNVVVWKRLADSDAFFLTTNCENGLILARRQGVMTRSAQDPYTFDSIVTGFERYAVGVGKHQSMVATPGA